MLKSIIPQRNWQYFLIIILFIFLFIPAAFRYKVGTDYVNYEYLFSSYVANDRGDSDRLEPGFQVIFNIISNFSSDPRLFFILTSFFILFFYFFGFLKYSKSVLLSIFLFVTLYYYFNSLNGVRQFFAMSLVLCFSTRFLAQRNLFKYLFSIIFASLFHISALIMIPAYWLVRKLKVTEVFFLLASLPLVFLSYDIFSVFIFKFFPVYQVYMDYDSGSANAFIFIQLIFFVIIFMAYKRNKLWSNEELVSLNLSIFSLFFFVLSYKNVMFFRLGLFFGMYLLILVPAVLNSFTMPSNRVLFYFICFILGSVNLSYHLQQNVSDVLPFVLDFNFYL